MGWCQDGEQDDPLSFTFYWENDTFTGTDQDYTNGLKLTWSKPYRQRRSQKRGLTTWMINWLPFVRDPKAKRTTSFSLGQDIYTPENTDRTDLIVDDRPYAGYTYISYGFQSQMNNRRDVWEIDIGVVGPLSQGEAVNQFAHDTLGLDRSNGWDNQLDNELGIEAVWEAKVRAGQMFARNGLGADFIFHFGGGIGNIAIYANLGCEFRFGWSVPNDFGTCPIRPGCDAVMSMDDGVDGFGGDGSATYFFLAMDGRLVLHDIFLDGNTFEDSHSVDKEPLVADFMAGVTFRHNRLRLSYAFVYRTKEFETKDDNHAFGAISISYAF